MSYADAENDVLRDELKRAKEAAREIEKLLKQTRMNPTIRSLVKAQLLWITSPRAAELNQRKERAMLFGTSKTNETGLINQINKQQVL